MGLIPGRHVVEFEQRVANYTGKKHGGMVNSGTSALMVAMRLLDRALSLRARGRSSKKYMFGTKAAESDGRFLEPLDGVDYDSLFVFEDMAYGFIPNEAGAAFGLGRVDRIEEL